MNRQAAKATKGRFDGIESFLLLVVEGEGLGGDDGLVRLGVAADIFHADRDETFLREALEGRRGAFAEVGDGEGAVRRVEQEGEDGVLFRGALIQFCERLGIGIRHGGGDAAGLRRVVLRAHRLRQDGADHAFDTGTIVVRDPARRLQQHRRNQRLGIDQRFHLAHRELALRRRRRHGQHRPGSVFLPDRHAHPAALHHRQPLGDDVIEDKLEGAVDEHAGDHGGMLRSEVSNIKSQEWEQFIQWPCGTRIEEMERSGGKDICRANFLL